MNQQQTDELSPIIKDHIINYAQSFLSSYNFETFNSFNIYSKEKQLEVLNNMIIERNDKINKRNGFPFVSYNFDNGIFNSDYFFEVSFELFFYENDYDEIKKLDLQNTLDKIIQDNLFKEENLPPILELYREVKNNYIDCKILELLLLKRNELTIDNIENLDIDFSNTKATEKIVMLYELGVLEFLRNKEPFNVSINSLATALSGITGEDSKTIQSYINPIFSRDANQKNNPLLSKKSVSKVNQKLVNLGFKPS